MEKVQMDWREFEEFARRNMSLHIGTRLTKSKPRGFPKEFDMVSDDGETLGDAKFLTLVRRTRMPPAKFMEIAGHVWLLRKTHAKRQFLVFGNQRRVPEWWLEKYGHLADGVEFYFLDDVGNLERLR